MFLFFQKLKYHFRAKNRHGIHSPFVYHFVDTVLNGGGLKQPLVYSSLWKQLRLNQKQSIILDKICALYPIDSIHFLDQEIVHAADKDASRLFIFFDALEIPLPLQSRDIVVLINPYASKDNFLNWRKVYTQPHIPLSLDVFELGILFFRKEFLVKQHFRLKC